MTRLEKIVLVIFIVSVLLIGILMGMTKRGDSNPNTGAYDFTKVIVEMVVKEASEEFGVPEEILRRIIWHESRGIPTVTNEESGAAGLMQIMPQTWIAMVDEYGLEVDDPHGIRDNIRVGAALLNYCYAYFGNWEDTLNAYAYGIGTAQCIADKKTQFVEDILY